MTETLELNLETYQPALLKECWKYYKQRSDVWDLLQDASIKMFKSFSSFDGEKPFLPWAKRIILTTYVDHIRAREREFQDAEVSSRQDLDCYGTVGSKVEEKVEYLLEKLSDSDRKLIESVFLEGETLASIGEGLGISKQAVSKRVDKAKTKLREAHDEYFN